MFEMRKTAAEDIEAINDLYRKRTGRNRTTAMHAWEWREGPLGPAPSWVIVERTTGRIAAHHGVIPIAMTFRGEPVRAARTENSMIDPDFVGRFVYHAFEAKALKELRPTYDLLFTTAGKGAPAAVRRRLGYNRIGRWHSYVVGLSVAHPARRILGAAAGLLDHLGPMSPAPRIVGWTMEQANLSEVAALWQSSSPHFALAPARNADWLNWRFLRNPYHRFHLCLFRRNGMPMAFAALREQVLSGGALDVHLDDVFTAGNSIDELAAVFALVIEQYRKQPVRILLRTLFDGAPLAPAAETAQPAGLANTPPEDGAELLALGTGTWAAADWQATLSLAQGI